MNRSILTAALLVPIVFVGATAARAGVITYDLINYPDDQNGWTLTGSITTDGTQGFIGGANILAWTWTATKGMDTVSVNSLLPNSSIVPYYFLLSNPQPVVYADSHGLSLPEYGDGLIMGTGLFGSDVAALNWFHTNVPAMHYDAFWNQAYHWDTTAFDIGTNDFLIATPTPEPATAMMMLVALLCCLAALSVHSSAAPRPAPPWSRGRRL